MVVHRAMFVWTLLTLLKWYAEGKHIQYHFKLIRSEIWLLVPSCLLHPADPSYATVWWQFLLTCISMMACNDLGDLNCVEDHIVANFRSSEKCTRWWVRTCNRGEGPTQVTIQVQVRWVSLNKLAHQRRNETAYRFAWKRCVFLSSIRHRLLGMPADGWTAVFASSFPVW